MNNNQFTIATVPPSDINLAASDLDLACHEFARVLAVYMAWKSVGLLEQKKEKDKSPSCQRA